MAQLIERALVNHLDRRKRYFIIFAVIINLALLGYFKYANFFLGSLYSAFNMRFSSLDIILPLGISFFTFTQLAFLIDTSQGMTAERSFSKYLLFVTFFPHLIAGPLIHHKQMMPQFADAKNYQLNSTNISLGLTIFILGLAKKIFIADYFGEVADPVFAAAKTGQQIQFFEAWAGILSYTLQLYFDFSAYSEMAIGLSLLFNIRMPLNFNSPCKSESIIDFWQRWHMTLTRYIGEYLYNPIAMHFMRKEFGRTEAGQIIYTLIFPTLITFIIAGLWHGANWTFLIFGMMHGVYLVINHLWRKYKKNKAWAHTSISHKRLSCLLTYIAVVFAFVFFRSDSVTTAGTIVQAMLGMSGMSLPATLVQVFPGIDRIASALNLSFNGIFPGNLFKQSHIYILLLLLGGHTIVWGMPNLHQLMCRFPVVTQDMSEKAMNKRETPKGLFRSLIWNPTPTWAVGVGIIFFAITIALATIKSSVFLYYQF